MVPSYSVVQVYGVWVEIQCFLLIRPTFGPLFRFLCDTHLIHIVLSAGEEERASLLISRYPGLVLRHLERERGGQKKGPNAHPIDGMWPSKFQKRGGINQGKAPSKGCAYKLAPQRHLVF